MGEEPPRAQWVIDDLSAALEEHGWSVSAEPVAGPNGVDVLIRRGANHYVVEWKALREKPRRSHLRAFMADAILMARAKASGREASPLAIVGAPSLSDRMVGSLEAYVREVAGDVAWGFMDQRGRLEMHGPGLDGIRRLPSRHAPDGIRRGRGGAPFSDLGQWMIKVLLAPRVRPEYLSAPRLPLRGVSDLAREARVSAPSASRLLSALESLGHLRVENDCLLLARVPQLLESWRAAVQGPQEEVPVRFSLPAKEPSDRLAQLVRKRLEGGSPRVCIGLFEACRKLGMGWVRGGPLHLYVEDLRPSSLAEELGLHPVEHPSLGELIVRRPRYSQALFRGSVAVGGLRVADAIQCWLDVSAHPSRGAEQANEVMDRLGLMEDGRGS